MALARVVTFEGVSSDRMEEMNREMSDGQPPEGFPSAELIALHDPDAEKSLVIIVFETEDDYKKGDEILNAMPAGDTPGRRTSVTKYNVATRMKS
jgi:heme-degrading monooxygenase HmoA